MNLAWRNLLHDRTRFGVTVVGIAFSVFLILFQGSLLSGFLRASSRVVDSADVDIWICARGVPALEFPAPIEERFRSLALGVPGVTDVYRLAVGVVQFRKPSGASGTVMVVGADPGVGSRLPRPTFASAVALPDAVVVDESDLPQLGLARVPADVEIGGRRAQIAGTVSGFGSFVGTPYVFARYEDALAYAGIPASRTSFLACRVAADKSVKAVRQALRQKLPHVDVWTRDEFSGLSRRFWVLQTGAGGAILMAAVLGFIVGVVIVSQTIYATTMENIEEFATLKAMGASRRYVRNVVLVQALVSGVAGYLAGVVVGVPLVLAARHTISWVHTPPWLPAAMFGVSLSMCALASLVSVRKALSTEPGRVFRA